MADFDQQVDSAVDRRKTMSRSTAILADNYTFLLVVGLIVLLITLGYLTGFFWFRYGGGLGARPVFGKVTAVTARGIQIDIGSKQGLSLGKGQNLLALRRGVFLADLTVKAVEAETATVVLSDSAQPGREDKTVSLKPDDTVILPPLGPKP